MRPETREAMKMLFCAKWNVPQAAKHCNLTRKEMMITKEKQKAQVKSKFYYIFWGLATASVFVGQMYVGSGYRQMAESFNRIMDTIVLELEGSIQNQKRFY